MLNSLHSFVQFEREIIFKRKRDKIVAVRRRGSGVKVCHHSVTMWSRPSSFSTKMKPSRFERSSIYSSGTKDW